MDIKDIKLYLQTHGAIEHEPGHTYSLEYEYNHETNNYFPNVSPIEYDVFIITIDYSTANRSDIEEFEVLKKHFQGKTYHMDIHACYEYTWLYVMTQKDYCKMDLYNTWEHASINEFERLQHAHYTWVLKHPKQFNNHVKKIMSYYGGLYTHDKADLLVVPITECIHQDFSPDTDDYLPF